MKVREMTESLSRNDDASFAASKNLIFAWILVRVLSALDLTRGAALFGPLQAPGIIELRWAFGLILFVLFVVRKRYETRLFMTATAIILYQFCFGYSNLGAFSFAPFYLFIFALVFMREPSKHLKDEAALLIGLIFLTSAVQKMNFQFLAGREFEMASPFLSYLHSWFPEFTLFPGELTRQAVAVFAIVTEIVIGVGIMLRPAIFAQIVALFVITLAFIHPAIHYVYFFFLPLLVLIPNAIPAKAISVLARSSFLLPVAYALMIKALITLTAENPDIPYFALLFNLLLFGFHVSAFANLPKFRRDLTEQSIAFFRTRKSYIVPAVLLTVFVGSFWFLPSPLGFNMFAARRFTVPVYALKIFDPAACSFTRLNWRFSPVSDSSLDQANDGTCLLRFPTTSGIFGIVKRICRDYSATQFELLEDNAKAQMNCTSARL